MLNIGWTSSAKQILNFHHPTGLKFWLKFLNFWRLFTIATYKLSNPCSFSSVWKLSLFQSMSPPVHCCPARCKWTPESALNKKSQDCSVIMYPVKKQTTSCVNRASIAQVISICSVGPDRSRQNCRLFFCAKLFVDTEPRLQT